MTARLVVVHGQVDAVVEGALRAVGLQLLADAEGTELWGLSTSAAVSSGPPPASPALAPAPSAGRLLTIVEAGQLLGLGRSTMYQLIARGEIETVHVGRSARIPSDAVDRLIERLRSDDVA